MQDYCQLPRKLILFHGGPGFLRENSITSSYRVTLSWKLGTSEDSLPPELYERLLWRKQSPTLD